MDDVYCLAFAGIRDLTQVIYIKLYDVSIKIVNP